jgi:2-keto-4-pentenoate hydratase
MTQVDIKGLAKTLQKAQRNGKSCPPLTQAWPDLTVEDAYQIQTRVIEKRQQRGLHGRPARVLGHKIGITSEAVMNWLKVNEPDFGVLLDDMEIPDGGEAPMGRLLQPKAEGEVAFVLKEDLKGPRVDARDVIRATDYLLPAIEIIDSRISDWKITYPDTIADNASSALFVLGNRPVPLGELDLSLCGMVLRKNGRLASTGVGRACLEHPVQAVVWLANKVLELGHTLRAGQVVLSGALGPVVDVSPGDRVEVEISHLGSVSVHFSKVASP